ncbi:MAG: diguanylate cyclase domain-containing protein [Sphingomonadaceae bacterium]
MGAGIKDFCQSVWIFVLAGAAFAAGIVPAHANGISADCYVISDIQASAPQGAALPGGDPEDGWSCGEPPTVDPSGRTSLRFDLSATGDDVPRVFVARLGQFERLTVTIVDADGAWRSQTFVPSQIFATRQGPFFMIDLPEASTASRYVIVDFDHLRTSAPADTASLYSEPPVADSSLQVELVIVAVIIGMLLMPLVLNAAFYRVLREDLMIWHCMVVATFTFLITVRSGLINLFLPMNLETWQTVLIWGYGFAAIAGVGFILKVIEPQFLDERVPPILHYTQLWCLIATAFHAVNIRQGMPLGNNVQMLAAVPVLFVCVWALWTAYGRGSRAARYQLIGWTPLALIFGAHFFSSYFPAIGPVEWLLPFYLGILAEATATALTVADRFLNLRRQRDKAEFKARFAEYLAGRDPLTGLMNRRALETNFLTFLRQGYTTLALLDLDNFKNINDVHGHGKGDEVLQAVAEALMPDDDTQVVRMGGEEFLLLLRGPTAGQQAEMRRQAITRLVSGQVKGLDCLVTASMGLLHIRPQELYNSFSELYMRADRLLYQAKAAGRNRTVPSHAINLSPGLPGVLDDFTPARLSH